MKSKKKKNAHSSSFVSRPSGNNVWSIFSISPVTTFLMLNLNSMTRDAYKKCFSFRIYKIQRKQTVITNNTYLVARTKIFDITTTARRLVVKTRWPSSRTARLSRYRKKKKNIYNKISARRVPTEARCTKRTRRNIGGGRSKKIRFPPRARNFEPNSFFFFPKNKNVFSTVFSRHKANAMSGVYGKKKNKNSRERENRI